jgi:two-component system, OmpR family, response regulator VicR
MRRILLVDDDYATLEVSRMVLERHGFEVKLASNGEEALYLAQAEPPDLVITDFMMPIMNGVELAAGLRQHPALQRVPVVLVSGSQLHEIGTLDLFDGHISKPIRVDQLLDVIKQMLG